VSLRGQCTERLGEGKRRRVYAHPIDPALVVKVAKTNLTKTWRGARSKGSPLRTEASFSNPGEWALWETVRGTKLEKWFVPCVSISSDGVELVQCRAVPCDKVPQGFPRWLTSVDCDANGFGVWKGAPRLLDYAQPKYLENARALLR